MLQTNGGTALSCLREGSRTETTDGVCDVTTIKIGKGHIIRDNSIEKSTFQMIYRKKLTRLVALRGCLMEGSLSIFCGPCWI